MSKQRQMQRHKQRASQREGQSRNENALAPAAEPTQVTSIVELSLQYDAARDSIVELQTNLPNNALDAVLLSRITQRLQMQALFAVLAERDQLVAQLQAEGGKNGKG